MQRDRRTPLPGAVVRRGIGRLLCRARRKGQALAYVYFEDEPGRRSAAKCSLTMSLKRIAVNFAKLPDLLKG